MATRLEVRQGFNLALEDALRGKVEVFFDADGVPKLSKVSLANVFRDKRGAVSVYWGDSSGKQIGGCCAGPQTRQVTLDCYGSDIETAERVAEYVEQVICDMPLSRFRRHEIYDQTLSKEETQTPGRRLVLTVSHSN